MIAGRVEVSEALPAEYPRLGELTLAAYRAVAPMPEDYAAELADVAGRAADPSTLILAARLDGRVIGGATVVLRPGSPLAELITEGTAGLRMVAVDPSAQGHGAGRALVEAAIELCRARGLHRLGLHTQAIFARAIHLYESLGFVRTPERDITFPSGLHLLAYALEAFVV